MAALPVLNQPPHRVGALLDHLTRQMRLRSEGVLTPLGIRPRHLLAMTVIRDRGGIAQQALATTLGMDGTNVVGLLNDLERDQLVERRRSPQDRRRHTVELTETGAKLLARAEFALATVEDEVLAALDGDQRETLYQLLQTAANGTEPVCAETVTDC
ncbi:MarR family winged helix-turn-helix transcriptional regulator [Amycolatopsis endophytica]|uniref:DNA-binding MarR family transcriptional regulator n=1 Tax=Amycolatopsis endophytica TaxID=860233 RepID=A0A853BDT1_9PSEU|nr:MarR family winged helix-turn-helix transcriptional regulator [Amycolatopsis endophytica]NYI93598.1 DNA-binding MarR family transcriptional regulator [Amycolatopsis endophytica]